MPKWFNTKRENLDYWVNNNGYTAKPKNTSAMQMSQNGKYWAKNDLMKLGDVNQGPAP